MKLKDAIDALKSAVENVLQVVLTDEQTQLESFLALKDAASTVGFGKNNFAVVVFGDINKLKDLNDNHGHETGDLAIASLGQRLKRIAVEDCRGRAFRRSGDEFVILLSPTALRKFKAKAKVFAAYPFEAEEKTLHTAISFGYAMADGEADFDELLKRAETACQVAKLKDGSCVAWSQKLAEQSFSNLSGLCKHCGTKIRSCQVPAESVPLDNRLRFCPCCGGRLSK